MSWANVKSDDIDRFEEVDESTELQELIKQTLPEEQKCSVVEYVNGEEEIPVCFDNGDDWDANFLASLDNTEQESEAEVEEDPDPEPQISSLKSFQEVITSLDKLKLFLDNQGMMMEATTVASLMDSISSVQIRISRQSSLREYFPPDSSSS